jgi:hypothetical protein
LEIFRKKKKEEAPPKTYLCWPQLLHLAGSLVDIQTTDELSCWLLLRPRGGREEEKRGRRREGRGEKRSPTFIHPNFICEHRYCNK